MLLKASQKQTVVFFCHNKNAIATKWNKLFQAAFRRKNFFKPTINNHQPKHNRAKN